GRPGSRAQRLRGLWRSRENPQAARRPESFHAVEDFVVRNAAVGLARLGISEHLSLVVAEDGLARAPLDHVLGLEGHLPSPAGKVDGEVRDGETAGPAAQLAENLDPSR